MGLLVAILCAIMLGLAPTQRTRPPILGVLYRLCFHDVKGLKRGDPVVMGGVPAGRVVGIDFAPREHWAELNPGQPDVPMVLVTVALDPGFKMTAHSGYKIIGNLRGQLVVNIVPGASTNKVLAPNSLHNQELDAEVEDTVGATVRNFKDLAVRTEDLRSAISDPVFRRDLKDGASNARFYSNEFLGLSKRATAQVDDVTQEIGMQERRLLDQAQAMDAQVSRAQVYINKTIPLARTQLQEYRSKVVAAQKQLDSMAGQADKFNANLKKLADQLNSQKLGQLDVKKLTKDVKNVAKRVDDYAQLAGDIHAITSDEEVRANIKGQVKKLKGKSESLKESFNKYEHQLDQFKWLMKEEREHTDEGTIPSPQR